MFLDPNSLGARRSKVRGLRGSMATIDGSAGADIITSAANSAGGETTTPDADAIRSLGDSETIAGFEALIGGSGNDTLVGGAGQDVLIGGLGNDQFLYTAVGDSSPLAADEITDFTAGQDKIDLRLIDGNVATALTYVVGAPTAAGRVGVVSLVGTAWQIQIDVNGGGVDATINITSATAPDATWLLL